MCEKLIGWCCTDCRENFFLEQNEESCEALGSINCPYCGKWDYTVMNTINSINLKEEDK